MSLNLCFLCLWLTPVMKRMWTLIWLSLLCFWYWALHQIASKIIMQWKEREEKDMNISCHERIRQLEIFITEYLENFTWLCTFFLWGFPKFEFQCSCISRSSLPSQVDVVFAFESVFDSKTCGGSKHLTYTCYCTNGSTASKISVHINQHLWRADWGKANTIMKGLLQSSCLMGCCGTVV